MCEDRPPLQGTEWGLSWVTSRDLVWKTVAGTIVKMQDLSHKERTDDEMWKNIVGGFKKCWKSLEDEDKT